MLQNKTNVTLKWQHSGYNLIPEDIAVANKWKSNIFCSINYIEKLVKFKECYFYNLIFLAFAQTFF
jgi:hypothetical protein